MGSTTSVNVKLSDWQDEVPGDDCCLFFTNKYYDYAWADPREPDEDDIKEEVKDLWWLDEDYDW